MENRLAKLRLGQSAGEIVTLSGSDDEDEVRFVVVPLTDGENLKAFSLADELNVSDSTAGLAAREEMLKRGIIFYAAREMSDWTKPFFESTQEVSEIYDHDINQAYDIYLEMVAVSSPVFALLDDEELENLKKVWSRIDMNELDGTQQYAARRFLNSIRPLLLQANFSGSNSMRKSTETSDSETPVENAGQERTIQS
jgi:hypothetical protein